ncbi:MAG: hypothetical protein LBI78_05015 [Campylobacteraceae bacterium]|jgi:hypothetical protein|nr:hypothetical protein [Campylobacteraceae bacterium]
MRTYTKLSVLAASFLIGSISLQAQEIIDNKNASFIKDADENAIEIILGDDSAVFTEDIDIEEDLDLAEEKNEFIFEELNLEDNESISEYEEIASDNNTDIQFTQNNVSENQEVKQILADDNFISKEESYSISLSNNGLIYASEDTSIGEAVLGVTSLSYVSIVDGVISEPITFLVRTNYSAFIERMEIIVYKASDTDLIEPLVTIPVDSSAFAKVTWDGKLPDSRSYKAGDELVYILKAYDKEGKFDESVKNYIRLLKPEDVISNKNELKEGVSKEQGVLLNTQEAADQYLLDKTFATNSLAKQNIVIYGSRVIIRGVSLPENTNLFINGESYPVDFERKFTAEFIVPSGTHYYDIDLQGEENIHKRLKVDVDDNYFFGIAIADFTLSKTQTSGSYESKEDDLLKDGRLAFYIKSRLHSKYQITAQADTTQKDVKDLFKGFTQADATDIFESLDPDMYYPTYGDDSTTFKDINTQGRFYLRTDWDKSQALWGNYDTNFDGTQYGGYSRSLYGAKLDYRSVDINEFGDAKTTVKAFGSEAQSAAGHSEFLGTGGSLYYLKNTNIIPGSDKLLLQVIDTLTGNVIARIDLVRGADYEIDNVQGRVILTRPLSQIIYQGANSITTMAPLSGYEQRLMADYEYVPNAFDGDNVVAGVRVKQWFGDHVALGGTYVTEEQVGDDYEMVGGDITLQAGKGTYLKTEITQTKSKAAPIYYSTNGGLSFDSLGSLTDDIKGEAVAVDARANFKELGFTNSDFTAGTWWRKVDKGYSSARTSSYADSEVMEYGVEVATDVNDKTKLYTKANKAEKDDNSFSEIQVTAEYSIDPKMSVSAEIKGIQTKEANSTAGGAIGALRVDYEPISNLETFLTGQATLSNDNGAYENNDAIIVGARYLFDASSAGVRYTTGHRGDAVEVDASYQLNKDHTIYGGYTWSNDYVSDFDRTFGAGANTGFTVGQRWNITNKVALYNESQLVENSGDKGATNSLGMDFYLGEGWNLGFIYQKGELRAENGNDTDRDSFSFNVGRTSSVMNWASKLEYRQDRGAEDREQWVTTNRLSYKVNDSLRLAGRLNYSKTEDNLNSQNGAEFTEANIGFAYRPYDSSKWALFGRYTYLYDLASLGQDIVNGSEYDQRSQVLSFEGVYKFDEKWEFALKYATRIGEARYGRGDGEWFDSQTSFYAAQARYDLLYRWHGLLEYRILDVKDGGAKQGYMLGIDRDITEHFRVGAGYNFTDFSDDLTKLDYKYRGWFINVVGTY